MDGTRALIVDGCDIFFQESGQEFALGGNTGHDPVRVKDIVIHAAHGNDKLDPEGLTQAEEFLDKLRPAEAGLVGAEKNQVRALGAGPGVIKGAFRRRKGLEDAVLYVDDGAFFIIAEEEIRIKAGEIFRLELPDEIGEHALGHIQGIAPPVKACNKIRILDFR